MSALWSIIVTLYVTLAVGLALWVGLAGLWAYLTERWHAYLARQLAPVLAEERRRHAADIEARRKEHQESQEWLMGMHRFAMDQMARRHRVEMDRAVADALTNVAPHPKLKAS